MMKQLVLVLGVGVALSVAGRANGQPAPREIVLEALRVGPTTPLKIFGVAGSIRLVGWDRDSVMVTSRSRPPDRG